MKNFGNDIEDFLKAEGFSCTWREVCGMRVLNIKFTEEEDRVILPLKISALSQEEAQNDASTAEKCIKAIEADGSGRPIIITEDRWHSQEEITKKRLLAHLNVIDQIYARNCEIKKIDKSTAAEFLNSTHSYGDAACRYRFGLYLKRHTGHIATCGGETSKYPSGTLVAVATFSNARKWIKGGEVIRSYEWTRYASLPGVRLSGGMGKLLDTFIKEVNPDDIMTYADLEWSEGKVYETLGFTLEGTKEAVRFEIDTTTWKRKAIRQELGKKTEREIRVSSELKIFQNFGSNKYRLKLKDYQ